LPEPRSPAPPAPPACGAFYWPRPRREARSPIEMMHSRTVMSLPSTLARADADLALVADVGGTNARFALCDPAEPVPAPRHPLALRGAEFPSLEHAARHYLAAVG